MNEKDIFLSAMEIEDPAARRAHLQSACAGNLELLSRVESLLSSHQGESRFLQTPVVEQLGDEIAATIVTGTGSTDEEVAGQRRERAKMDEEITLRFLEPSIRPGSLGRLAHYEILEVVGQGAFGTVLRAFDEKLQRVVAIKVMAPELAATSPARKRFVREAQASAQIRHENVVNVYGVEERPIPHLVMEYIPGVTLQQRLDERGPLDVPTALRLGVQISEGLAAAHAKDLIHRDIKPGNILLETGMRDRVKITDFGLARAADDASMTQSGVIAGTPMYMAPEQALGHKLDQRADLFSFGSVLYQMVSGRPPFRAASTLAVLKRLTEETPRPIQEIIPETPRWLCDIISKLHAKNPDDRFQSAKEVAELLEQHLAHLQNPSQVVRPAAVTLPPVAEKPIPAKPGKIPDYTGSEMRPLMVPVGIRWPLLIASGIIFLAAVILLAVAESTGMTHLFSGSDVVQGPPPPIVPRLDPIAVEFSGVAWKQLFNGKDLDGWARNADFPGNWRVEDGILIGAGSQLGMLQTARNDIEDFHFRAEVLINSADADGGIFFRSLPQSSNELNLCFDPKLPTQQTGSLVIHKPSTKDSVWNSAPKNLAKANDWMTVEIIARGGRAVTKVNGQTAAESYALCGNPRGHIVLQHLGPQTVVRFRKIELRELPPERALRFDGIGDLVTAPNIPFEKFPVFTVEAWVKDWRRAVLCQGKAADPENSLWLSTGQELDAENPRFPTRCSGWESGPGGNAQHYLGDPPPGVWTHLAMVFDGQQQFFFVGGRLVKSQAATAPGPLDATRKLLLGGHEFGDGMNYGAGLLGPVRISSVARWVRDFDPPSRYVADAQTELLYAMQDDDPQLLLDSSGHKRHGVITGATRTPVPPRDVAGAASDSGWGQLFNGKDLTGWKGLAGNEKATNWRVENGLLVSGGRESDSLMSDRISKDFKLRCEMKINKGSNASILFHRPLNPKGLPSYELQFDNKRGDGPFVRLARNPLVLPEGVWPYWPVKEPLPLDQWFTCEIWAIGGHITIHYDGKVVLDHNHPEPLLEPGCIVLHAETPESRMEFRRIEIKELLPNSSPPPPAVAPFDTAQAKAHQVAWAKHLGVPVEHTNSIGMKFVLIPPGEFMMGSTPEEIGVAIQDIEAGEAFWLSAIKSEAPQHRVILTQPVYLGIHEVTQVQYERVMKSSPSHFAPTSAGKDAIAGKDTANFPVEMVDWNDAAQFCTKLTEHERANSTLGSSRPNSDYRLPTEAEWEFACRAGTLTKYWSGDTSDDLAKVGWWSSNANARTHAVAELRANPFGVFDILGNVWEWVQDGWEPNYYDQFVNKPAQDPTGAAASKRVIRGGDWRYPASYSRASSRFPPDPTFRNQYIGFRVALPVDAVRHATKGQALDKANGDESVPFVILAKDAATEQKFATLAQAVAGAKERDTIEIRGNGPFPTPPTVLGKALTLRAAAGFRPVLVHTQDGSLLWAKAPLTLEGLEIHSLGNKHKVKDSQVALVQTTQQPLRIAHCRFVVTGELVAIQTYASPLFEVVSSEIFSQDHNSLDLGLADNVKLVVKNCTLAGRGAIALYQNGKPCQDAEIEFTGNTFVAAEWFVWSHRFFQEPVGAGQGDFRSLSIKAVGNVFQSRKSFAGVIHADVEHPFRSAALCDWYRAHVTWTGQDNLYAVQGLYLFCHESDKAPERQWNALKDWNEFWKLERDSGMEGTPLFAGGDLVERVTQDPLKLTAADFRLKQGSPGQGSGTDGINLGADIDLVGPGDAYETWKETPEYQDWLQRGFKSLP